MNSKNSETTLMVMNFFLFPLLFMSPALVPRQALPSWVVAIGRINPVAYAVEGARNLMVGIVELPPEITDVHLDIVLVVELVAPHLIQDESP